MDKLKSVLSRKDKKTDDDPTTDITSRAGQGSHFPGSGNTAQATIDDTPDYSNVSSTTVGTAGAQGYDNSSGGAAGAQRAAGLAFRQHGQNTGFGDEANVNPYKAEELDPRVDGGSRSTAQPQRPAAPATRDRDDAALGSTTATTGASSGPPLTDRARQETTPATGAPGVTDRSQDSTTAVPSSLTSGASSGPPLTDRARQEGTPATGASGFTDRSAAAPSSLTSTGNPSSRTTAYDTPAYDQEQSSTSNTSVSNPALTAATRASTREPTTQGEATPVDTAQTSSTSGLMNKVLGAVGLGSAAGTGAHEAGRDYDRGTAVDDTPNQSTTVTGTDSYSAPTQSGPPAGYRRESIPTTAYPSGTLDAPRAHAGPTGRDSVENTTTGQGHHLGRDAALGASAAGVGAVGAQEYGRSNALGSGQPSYDPNFSHPTFYDAATAPTAAEASTLGSRAMQVASSDSVTDSSRGAGSTHGPSAIASTGGLADTSGNASTGTSGQHRHHAHGLGGLLHHTSTAGAGDSERVQHSNSRAQTSDVPSTAAGQSSHFGRDAGVGGVVTAGAVGAGAYEAGRESGHVDQFAGKPHQDRASQQVAAAGIGSGLGGDERRSSVNQWADKPYSSREPGMSTPTRVSVAGQGGTGPTEGRRGSVDQFADKPYSSREPGDRSQRRVSVGGQDPALVGATTGAPVDQWADKPYSSREPGVATPKRVSVAGQGGIGPSEGRRGSVDQFADKPYSSREPGVRTPKRVSVSGQGGLAPTAATTVQTGIAPGDRERTSADQVSDQPYSRRELDTTTESSATPSTTQGQSHVGRDAAIGAGAAGTGALGAHEYNKYEADRTAQTQGTTSSTLPGSATATGRSTIGDEQHLGRDAGTGGGVVGTGLSAAESRTGDQYTQPGATSTGTTREVDPLGGRHTGLTEGNVADRSGYRRQGDLEAPGQFDYGAQRGTKDLDREQTGGPGTLPGESTTAASEGVGVGTIDPVIARDVGEGKLSREEALAALEGQGSGRGTTGGATPASQSGRDTTAGTGTSHLGRDAAIGTGAAGLGASQIGRDTTAGTGATGTYETSQTERGTTTGPSVTGAYGVSQTGRDTTAGPTQMESSHLGRDAAIGTGAAAAGTTAVAEHERHQSHRHGDDVAAAGAVDEGASNKKPSLLKRIFGRRKNKDTGEDEEDDASDEHEHGGHGTGVATGTTAATSAAASTGHPSYEVPSDNIGTTGATSTLAPTSGPAGTSDDATTHGHKAGVLAGGHAYEDVSGGAIRPSYNPFAKRAEINVPDTGLGENTTLNAGLGTKALGEDANDGQTGTTRARPGI